MEAMPIKKSNINVFIEMKIVQWYKEKTYEWWMKQWNTAIAIVTMITEGDESKIDEIMSTMDGKWKQRMLNIISKSVILCQIGNFDYKTEYLRKVLDAYISEECCTIETFGIEALFDYNTQSGDSNSIEIPPESFIKERVKDMCYKIEDLCEEIAFEDQQRRCDDESLI